MTFRWYLGGQASWFVSGGMQWVLFAWLVAAVLRQPPDRVGLAQMSVTAPAILFVLLGGAVADRADCRQLLIRYHLIAAIPPLALAAVIARGGLGYGPLVAYGVAMGTLAALVVPARDALLTRVAEGAVSRAVAAATATQFVSQLTGSALAATAGAVSIGTLLVVQAGVLVLGALSAARLAPAPARSARPHGESRLAAMRDGLREATTSDRIRPVIVAMLAVGALYVGAFIVLIPVIVRDAYGGGPPALALLNVSFWGGTIVSTLAQARVGAMRRPGRAMMIALALGAIVLAAMSLPGPLLALAALCLLWGAGAGVVMTQGRTIVQLAAPESHRARVLAVFQLGFVGAAPLGAVAIGYLARLTGPRPAAVYPAASMVAVLLFLLARSGLWRHETAAGGETAAASAPSLA